MATTPVVSAKDNQAATILSSFNDKDIEFYGKVIDQSGAPIEAVNVTGSVIYNNGMSSGVQEAHTITDAAGLFSFPGMKGRTFDYHLAKVGYETMPERDAFDYTELVPESKRHHPDPDHPVILKMWKLQGAEHLIHFERKSYVIPPDGTLVQINLTTGLRKNPGGDLIIMLKHDEAASGQRLQHYPWKVEISMPGGGIIETTERLMYLAPENGYQAALSFDQTGAEPTYTKGMEKQYYLRLPDGRYARLRLDVNTDTSPSYDSYVGLTWWLNPQSGSRNLEFDPKK